MEIHSNRLNISVRYRASGSVGGKENSVQLAVMDDPYPATCVTKEQSVYNKCFMTTV